MFDQERNFEIGNNQDFEKTIKKTYERFTHKEFLHLNTSDIVHALNSRLIREGSPMRVYFMCKDDYNHFFPEKVSAL